MLHLINTLIQVEPTLALCERFVSALARVHRSLNFLANTLISAFVTHYMLQVDSFIGNVVCNAFFNSCIYDNIVMSYQQVVSAPCLGLTLGF